MFDKILKTTFKVPVLFKSQTQSTNSDAKEMVRNGQPVPFIVLAEQQLASYGQYGRRWVGNIVGNLYLSYALKITNPLQNHLTIFAQYVAVKLCEMLSNRFSIDVKIKWPNDILIQSKKIGGLLLEVIRRDNSIISAILGIGINILDTPKIDNAPYQISCLQESINVKLDFDDVLIDIVHALIEIVEGFETINLGSFCEKWRSFDCIYGKNIILERQNSQTRGIDRGINELGELIVLLPSGQRITFPQGNAKISPDRAFSH
ncbi:MAG: biotin--[acetyl-CoA-carboxylase] ligase [Puniceicoccales bacterium]|jgi:BirA family biotin operon repressor/biotin-[acetyl-CoA-carboxylase] ligase|nr:biotin--[acetyl-CoA-carboxylase] ligase [Puniceicoccales bacterium]